MSNLDYSRSAAIWRAFKSLWLSVLYVTFPVFLPAAVAAVSAPGVVGLLQEDEGKPN